MSKSIQKILIVGGGTAGWMTAAYLNRFLPAEKCSVTLVESADLGTIGVGEATVPPLVAFMRLLGLDEDDFLVQCNATYKLGIKFIDWRRPGHSFWHPFGVNGGSVAGLPVFDHWIRRYRAGRDPAPYAAYAPQMVLGEMNRAPRTATEPSAITRQGAYAYHLDAKAFAGYLTRLSTARGVHHLVDDVSEVTLDEQGAIAAVHTKGGRKLEADLYIDCTGFASLLIERALGDKFTDWSRTLLCDRAVVLPVEHGAKPEMTPYTRATALSAGWLWRIPLAQRSGNGYVYASRYTSEEAATAEMLAKLGIDAGDAQPNHLRMRIGRRSNFWLRNCVSVGLSAGFLEPLESTGIYLIQKGIELLLDHFPRSDCSPALAQAYNAKLGRAYEEVRDFILLHYLLSEREDPFWRASREVLVPPTLAHSLSLYDKTGLTSIDPGALFQAPSFHAIAAGQGRLPEAWHAMADYTDSALVDKAMDEIKTRNFALAQAMPDHGELIKTLHKARKLPA